MTPGMAAAEAVLLYTPCRFTRLPAALDIFSVICTLTGVRGMD